MTAFAILVKSHLPDRAYLERLVESFTRHNRERIALFLILPDDERDAFDRLRGPEITILGESILASHLVHEPVAGFSAGYINQEIIKLSFWETGLADNYLCLDSDAQFIRDFSVHDFMVDDATPFTFLSDDALLRVEPDYFREHWQLRAPRLQRITDEIGLIADRLLTVHGQAVFSSAVLRSFRDEFLAPRGWDYVDALAIAPYEPTWYSLWLQHARTIPIVMREPVFKTFHNAGQHIDYLLAGIDSGDAARGYVGVIVNSNYSRGAGVISFDDDRATCLAAYLTETDLVRAAGRSLARLGRRSRGTRR